MPPLSIEERYSDWLAGLLTDEESAALHRDATAAAGDTGENLAALADSAALITMAGVALRTPPAALRDAVMGAAGIQAPAPAPPAVAKFSYLTKDEGWDPPLFPGARIKPLFNNPRGHRAFLLELQPGTKLPEHPHEGFEECLILLGDLVNEGRRLGPGDYVRATPGTQHLDVFSESGCLCVIIMSAA